MLAEEKPRDSYLGASDLPGVCGLDPHNPRYEVWARLTGRAEGDPRNRHMMRGIYLEPVVRNHLHEWKDDVDGTEDPDFHVHPEIEWIGSHNDGYALIEGESHTMEIKAPGRDHWHIIRDQGARTADVLQAQIGAGLRGDDECEFVIHNADEWLTLLFRIPFREDLFEYMIEQGVLFMEEHVRTDTPPDPFPDEPPPEIPQLEGEALQVHDNERFTELMEAYARYARAKKKVDNIYEGTEEEPGLKEELRQFALSHGAEEIVGEAGKLYYRPDDVRRYFNKKLVEAVGPFDPEKTREVLEEWFKVNGPDRWEPAVDELMTTLEVNARVNVESDKFHKETTVPFLRAYPSDEVE